MVGEPTGISFKSWTGANTAFDAAAAWSFGDDEDALHLHADFLMHTFGHLEIEEGALPLYYGIGGRLKLLDEDELLGVRVPVGLDFILARGDMDVFLEVVPILDVAPDTDFNLNAALGARYYF